MLTRNIDRGSRPDLVLPNMDPTYHRIGPKPAAVGSHSYLEKAFGY